MHGRKVTASTTSGPSIIDSDGEANITNLATAGLPSTVGRKPGSAKPRKRSRVNDKGRATETYTARATTSEGLATENTGNYYTLTWLAGTRIYVCYGCGRLLRPKPQANKPEQIPPPPLDIVLGRRELRMYREHGGGLTCSIKPQNCYYELKRKCLLKKNQLFNSSQVKVEDEEWERLLQCHRNLLKKEFGIAQKNTELVSI